MARLAIERGWKGEKERGRRGEGEEGRENNPNYDVVYEESKRDERRNPREHIPTAWVKTTRCWDIIGRGISKGEGVSFVVLHLAWRKGPSSLFT